MGVDALYSVTGSNNIGVGASAGFNLAARSDNIDIGSPGVHNESNTIRIGKKNNQHATFITAIHRTTTANMDAVPVVIDSAGQLGTISSSARFKNEIKPMDKASEATLGLKPVSFHYKSDHTGTPQFGLIAEEVAKVNPNLGGAG
jgi:Chaperone of endosialidase